MRSSIALCVVILSRTTQRALSTQYVSCPVDVLRPRIDRDRAATGGEPATRPGLREAVARLSFRERRGARQKSLVRESTDRTTRRHRGEERAEIRVPGEARVPRHRCHWVARELDHARTSSADVQHVERRAARAGEDAQVVLRSESPVLALVERVATSPDRGREEDAVGVFDTRRGQLGERLSDRAESRDDGVGAHAEVRKDALGSGEALENAEWGEDRRDERG